MTQPQDRSNPLTNWWSWAARVLVLGLALAGLGLVVYQAHPEWLGLAPAPSSAEGLVREFAALKTAGDSRAEGLLGPRPAVPDRPVSREEAGRLDVEFILRQPFRVAEVRAVPPGRRIGDRSSPQFVLVAKGSITSERFQVEGEATPSQRMLFNPDIVVEVRDGKLGGVLARLHVD